MTFEDQLWEMEERLWLDGADRARSFISDDAVMIFPYPSGILQGNAAIESMSHSPHWRTVRMDDRLLTRKGDIALLAYRVSAERPDAPIYRAHCASSYIEDGGSWRLVSHQQTPLGAGEPE